VKMIVEKQMECRLAGGNRSSRRKPAPAPLLSITKSHMTRLGFEPGLRDGKPAFLSVPYHHILQFPLLLFSLSPLSFLSSYSICFYPSRSSLSLFCFLSVPYSISIPFPIPPPSSSSRSLVFFSCCLFHDAVSIETTQRQMMGWLMSLEKMVEWELAGEIEIPEKIHHCCPLSTTNPCSNPKSNPGRRGNKPAMNFISRNKISRSGSERINLDKQLFILSNLVS
jgi:hypothetical protein